MNNTVVISTPPHVKSPRTTKVIMLDVAISLLPCAVMGCVYFGWQAALVLLTACLACVATEFVYFFIENGGFDDKCKNAAVVCKKWCKHFDLTSLVTGLILGLILPSTAKWYETAIGSIFAIAIVKMLFGGTGKNLVNPAATGRAMMFISFSLTTFVACNIPALFPVEGAVLESGATVLSGNILLGKEPALSLMDMILGTGMVGCIGETCKVAIALGYLYLVIRKVIKWWQPLIMIAVTGLVGVMFAGFDFASFLPLTLSGGLLFGAVYMATDYVTSPKSGLGQVIYLVFIGAFTAVMRWATHLEVVTFAIMIGNLIVPLIDTYFVRKPFGYQKPAKKEGK